MRSVGNFLWHVPFMGFFSAFFALLTGGLFILTVVGAPVGLGLIQFAKFLMAPYTHSMISKSELQQYQTNVKEDHAALKGFNLLATILWFPIGLVGAFFAAMQGVGCCLTIVGIPVGLVILKSLKVYLNPVGKICVPHSVSDEIDKRKGNEELQKYKLAS